MVITGIFYQEIPIYRLRQTTHLSIHLHLSARRSAPAKPHHVLSTKVRKSNQSNRQQSRWFRPTQLTHTVAGYLSFSFRPTPPRSSSFRLLPWHTSSTGHVSTVQHCSWFSSSRHVIGRTGASLTYIVIGLLHDIPQNLAIMLSRATQHPKQQCPVRVWRNLFLILWTQPPKPWLVLHWRVSSKDFPPVEWSQGRTSGQELGWSGCAASWGDGNGLFRVSMSKFDYEVAKKFWLSMVSLFIYSNEPLISHTLFTILVEVHVQVSI